MKKSARKYVKEEENIKLFHEWLIEMRYKFYGRETVIVRFVK